MRVTKSLLAFLFATGCASCDSISNTQVSIDSPTAMGMDCAVDALRENGLMIKDAEGREGSDVVVHAGASYMGLHAREDGYDIYISKVGTPNTCAELEQFAPHMRRAVKAISANCSGTTPPTTMIELPRTDCGIRVDR